MSLIAKQKSKYKPGKLYRIYEKRLITFYKNSSLSEIISWITKDSVIMLVKQTEHGNFMIICGEQIGWISFYSYLIEAKEEKEEVK